MSTFPKTKEREKEDKVEDNWGERGLFLPSFPTGHFTIAEPQNPPYQVYLEQNFADRQISRLKNLKMFGRVHISSEPAELLPNDGT